MYAIYLSPYTKDWITEFEREKEILLRAIGEWVKDIQHIGSTAIPGICAKPVIDIMIGVKSLEEADLRCTPAIQKLWAMNTFKDMKASFLREGTFRSAHLKTFERIKFI